MVCVCVRGVITAHDDDDDDDDEEEVAVVVVDVPCPIAVSWCRSTSTPRRGWLIDSFIHQSIEHRLGDEETRPGREGWERG